MLLRIVYSLMLLTALLNIFSLVPVRVDSVDGQVLGFSTGSPQLILENPIQLQTVSSFDQEEIEEYETIPYTTTYEDDPDEEYGTTKVLQPGVSGLKTYTYLVTRWHGEEIYRNLLSTVVEKPTPEIISKGTKVVWRTINTEYGDLEYWYKLKVWATKYDGNCAGCRGLTYSGTKVVKGVCAVDPKVIPLGTNFYVEGYGMCRSEDIGGGIKGNMVDLGYEDVMKGDWRTGYTNVYLLTSYPE